MNEYEVKIVNALLKKYYRRKVMHKDAKVNRRIDLTINKILKNYSDYNVDLEKKEHVNKAIESLENRSYIVSLKLKFSEDYEKIYLNLDNINKLEEYAANELGITPRTFAVDELKEIIKEYRSKGIVTDYYINSLEETINNRSTQIDVDKEKDILKTLSFLEDNNEFLYIREASVLIFSDSKYLENKRKSQVKSILANYYTSVGEDIFEEENLFERFNIYDTDQDICVKGPVIIEFENKTIDIDGLSGGVSFSIKDMDKIKSIIVNADKVMTIENKTSFLRMNNNDCYIYLGGFASKPQIAFIKKLISDNPDKEYLHFGDIDAGGFWIHRKLCDQTNQFFDLYHMSENDLKNTDYSLYLKNLSENDIKRLNSLKTINEYSDCINYMIKFNKKLEQEIVSYNLNKAG